jgi:hypothetical protein
VLHGDGGREVGARNGKGAEGKRAYMRLAGEPRREEGRGAGRKLATEQERLRGLPEADEMREGVKALWPLQWA